jgi:hypothetical protein
VQISLIRGIKTLPSSCDFARTFWASIAAQWQIFIGLGADRLDALALGTIRALSKHIRNHEFGRESGAKKGGKYQ